MLGKVELRAIVKENLEDAIGRVNEALAGEGLSVIEPTINRLGRNGSFPHWYAGLKDNKTLPNLDGKTIGSVLEMLFVAVLETSILKNKLEVPLRVNPARGIDLPDLDLGVKSPSENFCTSEPFFSAYERLYGNEHDCVVMLTDYQTAKKLPPLRLKVISYKYLKGSEVADENLCRIAKSHRDWLMGESPSLAKRVFRFLAYVNQSDWRAKQLLAMVEGLQQPDTWFDDLISNSEREFVKKNKVKSSKSKELIPEEDLVALKRILAVSPRYVGVLEQVDNWLVEALKDSSRAPNDNEWNRLVRGDLDGKIGMSFALQWRYNFGRLFGQKDTEDGL
ncbi:MAG: hypothetical protein IM328_06645 [Microcystis sp. M034S1]|uniref:hypothetical protein n=1 Tax=Microcystis sp. M034S1 TaxID=2771111 RepID=UPI002584C1F6|nr:hypothetical protein [Microcystis sp. M034S1]MCA2909086.1 hypothetical protein [Microcystis sp. M034S1]